MSCILILNSLVLNLSLYNYCVFDGSNVKCMQYIGASSVHIPELTIKGITFEDFKKEIKKQCRYN